MKHIQRRQFSFMKTSIKASPKILVYVFYFVSQLPVFAFSKMNSMQENGSKLSFTARIITKYFLERFLFIRDKKMT